MGQSSGICESACDRRAAEASRQDLRVGPPQAQPAPANLHAQRAAAHVAAHHVRKISDEELILLPPRSLAAVAELQDPLGFRRIANAGATPLRWNGRCSSPCDGADRNAHFRESDECIPRWEEEAFKSVGAEKFKPHPKGGFLIYDDAAPMDQQARTVTPLRTTRMPNACPAAPPPTPCQGVGKGKGQNHQKKDYVYATPPPPARGVDAFSTPPRERTGTLAAAPPATAEGNRSETNDGKVLPGLQLRPSSWDNLVDLARSHAIELKGRRCKPLGIAQTPPVVWRAKGKENARRPMMSPKALVEDHRSVPENNAKENSERSTTFCCSGGMRQDALSDLDEGDLPWTSLRCR